MNTYSYKTGHAASAIITVIFVLWIICFVGIALTSPLFRWTNLADYLVFEQSNSQFFQNIAKASMLLFGPVYVIFIHSFYSVQSGKQREMARLSLLFALAFAVLSCIHYFVQLSVVLINIASGETNGLELYLQANPYSIMTAIDMLGWTLFLGLSSLFMFPVFSGSKLDKTLRYAFLINGISCLLGAVGYIFQIDLLTFLCVNLFLGGEVLTFSIGSSVWFKRKLAE